MAFKQRSSVLPFKEIGSSPANQNAVNKLKKGAQTVYDPMGLSKDNFNIKGYLKGEQGFIPDYKGQSTKQTVHKVAKKVAKHTAPNVTQKLKKVKLAQQTSKEGLAEGTQKLAREAVGGFKEGGKMGLKDSMKRMERPGIRMMTKKLRKIMPTGYDKEQSKKDRLDYQSGGTGLGK